MGPKRSWYSHARRILHTQHTDTGTHTHTHLMLHALLERQLEGLPRSVRSWGDVVLQYMLGFHGGGNVCASDGFARPRTGWSPSSRFTVFVRPQHRHRRICRVPFTIKLLLRCRAVVFFVPDVQRRNPTRRLGPRVPGGHFGHDAVHPRRPLHTAAVGLRRAADDNSGAGLRLRVGSECRRGAGPPNPPT